MTRRRRKQRNKNGFKRFLDRFILGPYFNLGPVMRRWLVSLSLTFILLTGLFLSGVFDGLGTKITHHFYQTTKAMGFALNDVKIEGRQITAADSLTTHLDFEADMPLFAINLDGLKETLITNLAWVDNVRVKRHWPETLYIELQEAKPLARWQKDNKNYVVTEHKIILVEDDAPFQSLPLLRGTGAQAQAKAFLKTLYLHPELALKIAAADYIEQRRWNLITKDNTLIMLPATDMTLALAKLSNLQSEKQILQREIKKIDLRQADRLIIVPEKQE